MVFIENDAKLLLQRLPDDIKNVHYHDDETHIRQLLEKYTLVPKRGISPVSYTHLDVYKRQIPVLQIRLYAVMTMLC